MNSSTIVTVEYVPLFKGDLVELWSYLPGTSPILFIEDSKSPQTFRRIISKAKSIENGTIGFLLEDYPLDSKNIVIEVLVYDTIYLTFTSQVKKAYPPAY